MPISILRCSHDLKRKRKSTRLRSSRLCRVLRKETLFPDQHPSNVQFVSNQLGSQLSSSLMWHHKTYQRYHSIGWICLWLSWIIDDATQLFNSGCGCPCKILHSFKVICHGTCIVIVSSWCLEPQTIRNKNGKNPPLILNRDRCIFNQQTTGMLQ